MESSTPATAPDNVLIGRNVKLARTNQGLSQTELARRSAVDLATVYRVEKGIRTRPQSIKKIAAGLRIIYEDLLLDKAFTNGATTFAVNRASKSQWFPVDDRRHRVPIDQADRCQDPMERRRLGALDFVRWFMCPPTVIAKNGPGIVLLEIYSERLESFNAEFYEDAAVYILDGEAEVSIGTETVHLATGDWVAYRSKDLNRIAVLPPHEVVLILWIGANRVKKAN